MMRRISRLLWPSATLRVTQARVSGSYWRLLTTAMWSALLGRRSPPRLRRCRVVLPLDAYRAEHDVTPPVAYVTADGFTLGAWLQRHQAPVASQMLSPRKS